MVNKHIWEAHNRTNVIFFLRHIHVISGTVNVSTAGRSRDSLASSNMAVISSNAAAISVSSLGFAPKIKERICELFIRSSDMHTID